MPTITVKPVMTLGDGNTATLTFSKIDGDGCELNVPYNCRQFRGRFCNRFVLDSDFDAAGLCWRRVIYLFPQFEFPVSDDGFAVAEAAFDASEEYWEFTDDSEIVTWIAFKVDVSAAEITRDTPPRRAWLTLHTDSGELEAKFRISLADSLPTNAPETGEASGKLVASVNGQFKLDISSILNEKISTISEGSTLSELYVILQITPTGSSIDTLRIASSRHTDADRRPSLTLRY